MLLENRPHQTISASNNNNGYGKEYDRDCTSAMNVVPLEHSETILNEDAERCDIIAASVVKPREENPAEKNNRKY